SSRTGSSPSGRDMIHNELSNSVKIDSAKGYSGGGVVDLTGDEYPIDGDIGVGDSEVSVSLGEISSGGKKSRESSIGDTEDGGKIVGGVIESCGGIGNVQVRGMLIPDVFLTKEIHATDDYKEYEKVFVKLDVLMNQRQPVVSTQGTYRTTPRPHRTPTLTTASPKGKKMKQSDDRERDEIAKATLLSLTLCKTILAAEVEENIAKVQDKLDEEEIEKMVEGKEDEESYASEFTNSMLNDDDDSSTRIEHGRHKENPKVVDDDDVTKMKDNKKDEDDKKDDDVEKMGDAAEEKDNADHIDQTLVGTHVTGSMETRNEQMQIPIPTPNRSPRKDVSSDKRIFDKLTAIVSPTTATTSKHYSKS
ncbi:hypothetical protein Tco_0994234, partial [Tanacetum coccineum]